MIQLPDYSQVKQEMIAQRYRADEDYTRIAAMNACTDKNLALELYTGMGGNTKLYKASFDKVITNDINPASIATHKMSALRFIQKILPIVADKIDLVDFDCYGCPSEEIKAFFEQRQYQDCPLILTFADGLGLWLKRAKRDTRNKRMRQRYLLPDDFTFDEQYPWRTHIEIVNKFIEVLANKYGMKSEPICVIQTKFRNYVLGVYKLTD